MREPKDKGDEAQDYQARHNQAALSRVLTEAARPVGESLEICVDCLGEIPRDRREAQQGCTRCAECQALSERLVGGL